MTCETLVSIHSPPQDVLAAPHDQRDFYGREYWFGHQEHDLNQPNVVDRSRTDLPERCLHWLRAVLRYQLPPATALEIGSAHGGFVALLRAAGFDASGVELSPWVVDFARSTFGVPMLQGPIEQQNVASESLDLIAMLDVFEHLDDPVRTLRHCLNLLRPGGVLLIQTPRFPEGASYNDLVARADRFLDVLLPAEHLYLFSERSIREFFTRLGCAHVRFEPAIFAHYDMFLVASRLPLAERAPTQVEAALSATPQARLVLALLDLDVQCRQVEARLAEAERDRAVQLRVIEEHGQRLAEAERDRAARLRVIEEQGHRLEEQGRQIEEQAYRIQSATQAIRRHPPFALLRRLGLGAALESQLLRILGRVKGEPE